MSETPPDDEVVTRQAQEEAEQATADDDHGRAQTSPALPESGAEEEDSDTSEATPGARE